MVCRLFLLSSNGARSEPLIVFHVDKPFMNLGSAGAGKQSGRPTRGAKNLPLALCIAMSAREQALSPPRRQLSPSSDGCDAVGRSHDYGGSGTGLQLELRSRVEHLV